MKTEDLQSLGLNRLTASKAAEIASDVWNMSGVVLVNPFTGERCIVDIGAVRWIDGAVFYQFMHPDQDLSEGGK